MYVLCITYLGGYWQTFETCTTWLCTLCYLPVFTCVAVLSADSEGNKHRNIFIFLCLLPSEFLFISCLIWRFSLLKVFHLSTFFFNIWLSAPPGFVSPVPFYHSHLVCVCASLFLCMFLMFLGVPSFLLFLSLWFPSGLFIFCLYFFGLGLDFGFWLLPFHTLKLACLDWCLVLSTAYKFDPWVCLNQ